MIYKEKIFAYMDNEERKEILSKSEFTYYWSV